MKYPQGKYERHPLNVPGPFYIEEGDCINCHGPVDKARDLVGFFEAPPELRGYNHCYIQRQPANPEEAKLLMQAMEASMCSGLRYCGDDPAILEQFKQAGLASRCDELSD